MESYIPISYLNDFIFCPRSIYFHQLYGKYNSALYKKKPQIAGKSAHTSIDQKKYTTKASTLQSLDVYSNIYNLCGKIDLFDTQSGRLTERKRKITNIYDGYIFQVYAHCHALTEMGYEVKSIMIHDITHNKNYPIPLPQEDPEMQKKFEDLLQKIHDFDLEDPHFTPNKEKCKNCIYSNLCDQSLC